MTRKRLLLLVGVPLIFLAAWIYPYIPGHDLSPCAIRHMLGINCPGCGLTRSIVALVHGRLKTSMGFHPMGVVFIVIFVYLWLKTVVSSLVLKRELGPLVGPTGIGVISIAFVVGLFVQWFVYLVVCFVVPGTF